MDNQAFLQTLNTMREFLQFLEKKKNEEFLKISKMRSDAQQEDAPQEEENNVT